MVIAVSRQPERVYEISGLDNPCRSSTGGRYGRPMTATVHDVAAAVTRRLPGLPPEDIHRLVYYTQGHYLAEYDKPLFDADMIATDDGPHIPALDEAHQPAGGDTLPEAAAAVVDHVTWRYGALDSRQLRHLTRQESPWVNAHRDNRPIDHAELHAFFAAPSPASLPDPRLTDPAFRAALAAQLTPGTVGHDR
ncbi:MULTISPECIES: Panacea domain-containing protein [Catenuloplanes]|uniref:Phage-associated protein n=1 Tax=Catenuloplanes niger TaxID=587534 RepID=A0AAE3ZXV1_9ACTN|nr:type II toxin-antitoxin system antitoxin SocA domain-containing protein [Catenuloplanes niger]MDR7326825.1 putative phage-associated protein [Catenuloplanes niger]